MKNLWNPVRFFKQHRKGTLFMGNFLIITPVVQDKITISGTVTDENGSPLPGAAVVEKETNNGTITNTNGLFSINVDRANVVLVFSFVGYEQQEVAVGNRTSLMKNLNLDEPSTTYATQT